MRYIGAIKACESEFLQMVIALLWAGLGWSRSGGEGREIVVLSELLLLQTLSGELLRPSPPLLICYSSSSTPSSHPKLNFAIAYKIKSCLLSSFCESWRKRTGSSRRREGGRGRGGRGLPIIQVSPIVVVVQLHDGDFLQLNEVSATLEELHIASYHFILESNSCASCVNRRTI